MDGHTSPQAGHPQGWPSAWGATNPANPLLVPLLKAVGWQFLLAPKPVAKSWSLHCQALCQALQVCVRACVWGGGGQAWEAGKEGFPRSPPPSRAHDLMQIETGLKGGPAGQGPWGHAVCV